MQGFHKILVANRGEIARRIIRTARSMAISPATIYTGEEKDALHVREADEAICLGDGNLLHTYLNIPLLIKIARETHCDAIHPGYGFLSENADFAEACKLANIIFIGPDINSIRLMGNKLEARRFIQNLGIPLLTSIKGSSLNEILQSVDQLTFPVMIKAAAGGGGKGIKIVHHLKDIPEAWESASREARSYFGDPTVYLEHYIPNPRHIEVQVFGDLYGNAVHLCERECSMQRRHQKIIEEAPSPSIPDSIRDKLQQASLYIVKALKYTNAGTIEFLLDEHLNFYFLEMNTRIQVEHPITEAITGVDMVKEQMLIAQGHPLSFQQQDIVIRGHAIECRIYAEDPYLEFMPSAGHMTGFYFPEDNRIRIDSAYNQPALVSSSFDPMIAKLISHGTTREDARKQLIDYLNRSSIQGIKTNVEFLNELLQNEDYIGNKVSTTYCEKHSTHLLGQLTAKKESFHPEKLIAAMLSYQFSNTIEASDSIWSILGPWRSLKKMKFMIGHKDYEITYQKLTANHISFYLDHQQHMLDILHHRGSELIFRLDHERYSGLISTEDHRLYYISINGLNFELVRADISDPALLSKRSDLSTHGKSNRILSPLNGKIIKLNVKPGDKVSKGETLLIIESMKMENKILAPQEAIVEEVIVNAGDQVIGHELLIKLKTQN